VRWHARDARVRDIHPARLSHVANRAGGTWVDGAVQQEQSTWAESAEDSVWAQDALQQMVVSPDHDTNALGGRSDVGSARTRESAKADCSAHGGPDTS